MSRKPTEPPYDEIYRQFEQPPEQPKPYSGQKDSTEALIRFLRQRQEYGRKKYGQSLCTFDGRNNTLDILQESTDLTQYLFKEVLELLQLMEELYSILEGKISGSSVLEVLVRAHLKWQQWKQEL